MAFFKMRKGGDDIAATPRQPESVEAMRRRARHRLIGAGVLVLIAIVGFPLLFDTQPRPIAVDIPIEIPDRNKVKPLPAPMTQAPTASGTVTAAPVASAVKAEAPPPLKTEPPPVEAKAEPKVPAVVEAKPEPKAAEPNVAASKSIDDGARAMALLEGKAAASQAAGDARFIVQVGAFADNAKAREIRLKVERAGMKTYTHVAETKDGKLTRVRVGPFPTKAEADKAAEKLKALDLDPQVLKL